MSGEWIPVDINLGDKEEIQLLIDSTGESVEVCCYRMLQLWGWASLNTADGTARMTPARLGRVCGGDEQFWLAVQTVGWIVFDPAAGTAEIPGWGKRFSSAAKARQLHAKRAECQRYHSAHERTKSARTPCASSAHERTKSALTQCASVRTERTTGEESTESPPPPPRDKSLGEPGADGPQAGASLQEAPGCPTWHDLVRAWNSGHGKRFRSPNAPPEALARLADPNWFPLALAAIDHLPRCRWFRTPVDLLQFVQPDFADRVLAGKFDDAPRERSAERPGPGGLLHGAPPARGWEGEDAKRAEWTRAKLAEKMSEIS